MTGFWQACAFVGWMFLSICGVAYLTGLSVGLLVILTLGGVGLAGLITALWPKDPTR